MSLHDKSQYSQNNLSLLFGGLALAAALMSGSKTDVKADRPQPAAKVAAPISSPATAASAPVVAARP